MTPTRRPTKPPLVGEPEVTPAQGRSLLLQTIGRGRQLLTARPLEEDAYENWRLLTRNYLERAFGANHSNVSSVMDVGIYGSFPMGATEEYWENRRAENLASQLARLDALAELLHTEQQLVSGKAPAVASAAPIGHRIFLVHGHDEGLLQECARFLAKLEQEYVILREQPNQGRTIIEKFEDYADVGFAIVLLTHDDRGGAYGTDPSTFQSRARQNVILELGYFLGRLGRSRVCALYRPGVEIPSDYTGVLYTEVDERGAWKLELARELRAADFAVDMNRAL